MPRSPESPPPLDPIFGAYTKQKRANDVVDYDDLLLFWQALTTSPVGDVLRDLFDHDLIDEYQDTNPIHADIVRGMGRPDTDLAADGDDARAIFGFRATTVENMWRFADHFPGARRSSKPANAVSPCATRPCCSATVTTATPSNSNSPGATSPSSSTGAADSSSRLP